MNFKPALWKVIVSVLLGVLAIIFSSFYTANKTIIYCIKAPCPTARFQDYLLTSFSLEIGLLTIVISYLIWSHFQKK